MFGSDWPVCELAGSYETVFSTLRELTQTLSASEQNLIFGETAQRFYRLQV
jgi:L-fuconolactonase